MNVSLTAELEEFVARKVSSGRYQTVSEVVREGLRLLEERDAEKQQGFMVASERELREKIRQGIEALDRGEYSMKSAKEIIADGRRRQRKNA